MSNHSIHLTGTGDTGTVASNAFADDLPTFSVSWWMKSSDATAASWTMYKAVSPDGWGVSMNSGRIGPVQYSNVYYIQSTTLVNDGVWHHIVVTMDNTVGWQIYIDGALETPFATSGSVVASYPSTNVWGLGGNSITPDALWYDVQFFNRVVTSGEVTTLFGHGTVSSGKLAEWLFTEGSGTTATDTIASRVITFTSVSWSSDTPGQAFTQSLNDSISETDSLQTTLQHHFTKSLNDSLTPSESFGTLVAYFRTITNSLTPSEAISKQPKKVLADFVFRTDSIDILIANRQLNDSVLLQEWLSIEHNPPTDIFGN